MSFFSYGGGFSPPKGQLSASSPTIPFCTSPSQLQEMTLDQDTTTFSNGMGLRSPKGRSVKEFEEQLTNLRKENFNLKLRIYFLEEKMGTNFTLDKDNVVKKNIELQIELENLKKEVQEKHGLLCQAVKALDLQDDEHKEYISSKEKELNMCQQELEDLRVQLQLLMEKENSASLQLMIGQMETTRTRYDNLLKEFQVKNEIIKNLHEEIELANEKVISFTEQTKDLQEKFEAGHKENQILQRKIHTENKKFEDLMLQMSDLKKKYANSKAELELERKMSRRASMVKDAKITELEKENEKHREKVRDLEVKLESTVAELRRSQNLAVSKSPMQNPTVTCTDVNSISVSDPNASSRTPKTVSLHVQVGQVQSAETSLAPLSPFHSPNFTEQLGDLETFLQATGNPQILTQYRHLKAEHAAQKQKIIKLKSEQLKACQIIKTMIESRNRTDDELSRLKAHCERLERELEQMVSKPACESGDATTCPSSSYTSQSLHVANVEQVEKSKQEKSSSMAESKVENLKDAELYKALSVELEAKIEVLMAISNEKDSQMEQIREKYEEVLISLEEKEKQIVNLEFELVSLQPDRQSLSDNEVSSSRHSSVLRQEIEEKDKEIERLGTELKKCTCYLQEIVNKELWDKNKEIEKLQNKQTTSPEMQKLKNEVIEKNTQLRLLKEKIFELGLDISLPDITGPTTPLKSNQTIKNLQDQLKMFKEERDVLKEKMKELENEAEKIKNVHKLQTESLRNKLDKAEKLRQESNEICSLLNSRLEELAMFLKSLLKQKSVLGYLGIHKERKLREVVDNSLDLSKSVALNNPDQSYTHLLNITALLNKTVFHELTLEEERLHEDSSMDFNDIPSNISLTYESHFYKRKNLEPDRDDVISVLREQIINLKSELQLRDNELNKLNNLNIKNNCDKSTETEDADKSLSTMNLSKLFISPTSVTSPKQQSECQSESECWSEPDRIVSRARIGLSQTLPVTMKEKKESVSDTTEEESVISTTPTKRSRQNINELYQQINELQDEVKRKTNLLSDVENKNKDIIKNLEINLNMMENKLDKAEAKKVQAESEIKSLEKNIEELTVNKRYLEETMIKKDKETQNLINQLQIEKEEALKISKQHEVKANEAKRELKEVELKLAQMQKDISQLEDNLRLEYEHNTISKLREVESEFIRKLKQFEDLAEEKLHKIQEEYSTNYISKLDVETKLNEVNLLKNKLDELKDTVNSYERIIETYKLKEQDMNKKMIENQDKINILRKELDSTTLQYSEVVLEKTKLANEKTQLEQEFNKYHIKDAELKQQINDIRSEFESCQQQLASLQKQKSKLQVKNSELESLNAELHNRYVRLQANSSELNISVATSVNRTISLQPHKRQFSDQPYEETVEECVGFHFERPLNPQRADIERCEANSSPDLGIESDHGRFSSLETQTTVPRPLLQSIELTESMSNLITRENNHPEKIGCENEHCCPKSLEIAQENNELKRKLLRMRRALEETANQLNLANQRKQQVEKTICKQIHNTRQVLRKVKTNLVSGSETDMLKQ